MAPSLILEQAAIGRRPVCRVTAIDVIARRPILGSRWENADRVGTIAEHDGALKHECRLQRPAIDDQIFQWKLQTILNAWLYGHVDEAYALRAIARAIREWRR